MSTIEDTSLLPREASTARVERICREVSRSSRSKKSLISDLDENNDAVYDTIRLGEHLGLLNNTDAGVVATNLGRELIESEGRDRSEIFAEAISNHDAYCQILQSLEEQRLLFEGPLERRTVLSLLEEDYGIELSEKTLKERVGTFFDTMEAAGLGEYVFGSQNTICHFDFKVDFRSQLPPEVLKSGEETEKATYDSLESEGVQTTISGNPLSADEVDLDYHISSEEDLEIRLSLDIDDSTGPKHLEELILAIRRAMQSDL